MPTALPLTDRVSQSSTRTRKNRVIRAQFGDGYEQTRPDGINWQTNEYQVSFENLTDAERTSLWTALDLVGSHDYLTWQPPGFASSKKWKVASDISETAASGDLYSISFTLKQFF